MAQRKDKKLDLSSAAYTHLSNTRVSAYPEIATKKPIPHIVTLLQVVKAVQNGRYADLVAKIRSTKDKKARSALKLQLPAFTTSGIYFGKAEGEPSYTTGLIQIDIDELGGRSLAETRAILQRDTFTFIMFTSPSGKGLKLIVSITKKRENFLGHYFRLEKWYKEMYGITIDTKCKNINRVCFFSHDPDIYIRELPATKLLGTADAPYKIEKRNCDLQRLDQDQQHTHERVKALVAMIELHQIDITGDYSDWIKIGYALSSLYGADGEAFFLRISKFYPGYSEAKAIRQYQYLLRSQPKKDISALFGIAKDYGLSVRNGAETAVTA